MKLIKKTLCIDIGIKNLAMCIISCEDNTRLDSYEILLWDVYNTLGEEHKCQGIQKNNKVCGKKCSYKYESDSEEPGFTCKTHFPKDIKIEKKHKFTEKKVDSFLLQDIATLVIKKVNEIYNDNVELFMTLDNISIELQPKINPKMKMISHIVYGKLTELMFETGCQIRFVRASNKLKAYTGPQIECKLKGKYSQRKWLGIRYTRWFLENKFSQEQCDKWSGLLDNMKKADDACDANLMAINVLYGMPKKQRVQKNGKCIK